MSYAIYMAWGNALKKWSDTTKKFPEVNGFKNFVVVKTGGCFLPEYLTRNTELLAKEGYEVVENHITLWF